MYFMEHETGVKIMVAVVPTTTAATPMPTIAPTIFFPQIARLFPPIR